MINLYLKGGWLRLVLEPKHILTLKYEQTMKK
jgi:hypothetical protein